MVIVRIFIFPLHFFHHLLHGALIETKILVVRAQDIVVPCFLARISRIWSSVVILSSGTFTILGNILLSCIFCLNVLLFSHFFTFLISDSLLKPCSTFLTFLCLQVVLSLAIRTNYYCFRNLLSSLPRTLLQPVVKQKWHDDYNSN